MATSKMILRQRSTMATVPHKMTPAEASPDSKCPICLDKFNNISYLDLCLHKFCFRCIHEWSKNKAECPLCKQPFNSIYHSIKSEQDFKKYDLRPLDNGSFGTFGGERFRYRTTLTGMRRQAQRRTSPPPDNGVLFESMSGHAEPQHDRSLRRIMTRLAKRSRAANDGREVPGLQEQEMVKYRRELYRRGARVRSVRDGGRSRDVSAQFYRRNTACLHRLVPWLKRELIVLYGARESIVNIVQHIIMSRITQYDMEDQAIQEELRPFLQGRTEHFLHEFISFAKSPFNMEAYDRHAVYDCPAPSSNEDSSSNSSVIAISEDEQDSADLDPPGHSQSNSALSLSAWDDETPGPSYSTTADRGRVQPLSVPDSESDSSLEEQMQEEGVSQQCRSPYRKTDSPQGAVGSGNCLYSDVDGDDDCVIVGFVKPMAERTPELVQLTSDSEESVHEVDQLPNHIRFNSESPTSSQSKDQGSKMVDLQLNQSASNERQSPVETYSREESSRRTEEQQNRRHHCRDDRRRQSRDSSKERSGSRERRRRRRSTDRSRSNRSPLRSPNRDGTFSRTRRQSRSSSRDRYYSRWVSQDKRKDKDVRHSWSNHEASVHSYNWQSRSHNDQDRDKSGTYHLERRSYYFSYHSKAGQRSRSRSRSHSSEPRHRDRRRSRSYSSTGSPSVKRRSRHDKPGGKRKYKTRHLEDPIKSPSSKMHFECDTTTSHVRDKKKSEEKRHRASKEKSRSLSVEIVGEVRSSDQSRKHHKKKKKHKKSKRHKSKERTARTSPIVITIDSDSDDCNANDAITDTAEAKGGSPLNNNTDITTNSEVTQEPPMQETDPAVLPLVADASVVKTGSPQTSAASTDQGPLPLQQILKQDDVGQSDDKVTSRDELNGHIPLIGNASIS